MDPREPVASVAFLAVSVLRESLEVSELLDLPEPRVDRAWLVSRASLALDYLARLDHQDREEMSEFLVQSV